MRKVVLSILVSLDGFIARPDRSLDWFLNDADFEKYCLNMLRSVDAILVGRVTYEMFSEYWPTAGTESAQAPPGEGFTSRESEQEMARLMNSIPKIVFSRTLSKTEWGPASLIKDNLAEAVQRLKEQPGKDLILFAGASIAQTFINLDLFDEYRLLIHPIVLGKGIPLFANLNAERELTRTDVKSFGSGVVVVHYARDRTRVSG